MLDNLIEKVTIFVKEKPALALIFCVLVSIGATYFVLNFHSNNEQNNKDMFVEEVVTDTPVIGSVLVEISGAVLSPGVYELTSDARIIELIQKGGGLSTDADIAWVSKNINLSKKLQDSQKVYVPFVWDTFEDIDTSVGQLVLTDLSSNVVESTTSQSSSSNVSNLININTSSIEQLDTLPGIGPTYAQKIIDNRPYQNIEELKNKSGVPVKTLDSLKDLITF